MVFLTLLADAAKYNLKLFDIFIAKVIQFLKRKLLTQGPLTSFFLVL